MANPLSVDSLLKNPKYNPKLALFNYAKKLAANYGGYVAGGTGSNYLSKVLSLALEEEKKIDPFTLEPKKKSYGVSIELSNNIFESIYNKNLDPKLQLQIFAKQRESLQLKEEEKRAERSRYSRLSYGEPQKPRDIKKETLDFINKLFPNDSTIAKNINDISNIPSIIDAIPPKDLLFADPGNKDYVFKELQITDSLNIDAPTYLSLSENKPTRIGEVANVSLPVDVTHVAVKLSGDHYLEYDPRYPLLDPSVPTLYPAQGSLTLAGKDLDTSKYTILTVAEWHKIEYNFSAIDKNNNKPDFLSLIPLQDVDGDHNFTKVDKTGELSTLPLSRAKYLEQPLPSAEKSYSFTSKFPIGHAVNSVDIYFEALTPDLLSKIAKEEIEVIVNEVGRDTFNYPVAILDISASTNNRLRFTFDRKISDGVNVNIYIHGVKLEILALDLAVRFV